MSIGDKQRDSITASAQIVSLNNPSQIRLLQATHQNWQRLAWNYYDGLPDVHYPANFFAWTLSKFKLFGARRVEGVDPMDEPEATDVQWVRDAIDDLSGVGGGQSEILRKYGLNWMMCADMYLVGEQGPGKVEWEILSVAEVDIRDDRVYRIMAPGHEGVEVATNSLWRRIWKSHPKYSMLADGAMRSLAGPCEELELLNADIMARIRSRLAMAGILFMPNSLSIPGVVGAPNGDGTGPADPFIESLQKAMLANISNPGTAGAVIPIMVRGPDAAGEQIKHIVLDRAVEEHTFNQRAELRMNIATGLDLPQEVQTDMKELNHWTSWTVMDSTLENHMVPPVRAFAEALTRIYLHPYGRALGVPEDELRQFCVWEDHSDVIVRPNKASDTRELRGLGLITAKATINGAGLGEEDVIGDDEYVRWVGVKTANPYLSLYGLPVAGDVDWAMVEATGKGKPPGSPGTLPGRTTVDNSNTTAGQPDPNIGKQAGGAITAALAADFVVAGPDYTDGVMVCVRPTPEQAARLTFPGGLPVDEMHCTLAYFGKVTDPVYQELGDRIKAELLAAICDVACETEPFTVGEVSGVTVFSGNETRPLVCLVDVPGLSELRAEFMEALEGTADDVVAENHGFSPHITLGYDAAADGSDLAAAESRVGEPLSFLAIELVFGTERYTVPFTGGADEMPMMAPMAAETVDVAALERSWRAERLAAAADVALDDVWKVAGAKMRALVSQPSLENVKSKVKGVPNERVVPILRDWAVSTGFDLASIVEFNGLTERVESWEPDLAHAFMAGLTGLVVQAFSAGDRESITSSDLLDFAGALLQPLTDRQPEE